MERLADSNKRRSREGRKGERGEQKRNEEEVGEDGRRAKGRLIKREKGEKSL